MKRTLQFLSVMLLSANVYIKAELPDPATVKQGVLIAEDILGAFDMNDQENKLKAELHEKYNAEDVKEIVAFADEQSKGATQGMLFALKMIAPDVNNLDKEEEKITYLYRIISLSVAKRIGKEVLTVNPQMNPTAFNFNQPMTFNGL